MTQPDKPRCETCRFAHINWRAGDQYMRVISTWDAPEPSAHETTSVQCRRHAPRMAGMDNQMDGWPWVQGFDWCGEYQETPDAR